MGPKKSRKRRGIVEPNQDEDESKWAKMLQQRQDEANTADDLYVNKDKRVFQFNFDNEEALYRPPKSPKHKKEERIDPEVAQALRRRAQLKRAEKEIKDQIKMEKKMERQKLTDEQKKKEQKVKEEKEEGQKKLQNAKKKRVSGSCVPMVLLVSLVLMGLLNIQGELYSRLAKFRFEEEVNYYEVLGAHSKETEGQLKTKYKKLVLKYHPDKNQGCEPCKEKFDEVMRAWEVLGTPEKREQYDQNSGFINEIKSESITLTPYNYHYLVSESNDFWLIQVLDSTDQFCHYFAQMWERMFELYGDVIKLGRIDVWAQSQMQSYVPYRFQIFPGVYYYHQGSKQLCQLDYDNAIGSMRRCIEQHFHSNPVHQITDLIQVDPSDKPKIIIGGEIRINAKFKIIARKFVQHFEFYQLKSLKGITALPSNLKHTYKPNSKDAAIKLQRFLESLITQTVSICSFKHRCENEPCLLLLEQFGHGELNQTKYPVFRLKEAGLLSEKIEELKLRTHAVDKFEVGLYQNEKIDLGYKEDVIEMDADLGEYLDIECRYKGWVETAVEWTQKILHIFN